MTENQEKILRKMQNLSNCRRQKVGCIVCDRDGIVIAGGYNKCRGDFCLREVRKIPSCTRRDECFGCHAEVNAAIDVAHECGKDIPKDLVAIATHKPCVQCTSALRSVGIQQIEYIENTPDINVDFIASQIGVSMKRT